MSVHVPGVALLAMLTTCDDNTQSQSDPLGMYKVDDDSTGLYSVKDAIKKFNSPITVDVQGLMCLKVCSKQNCPTLLCILQK